MILASAFGSVHDFFHSSTWYVMRNLALFFVLVFWVATVYWVHKDARRRIEDPMLVWVSTILGIVPFIGPLIYMLFRPPEYLEDVRERELEIKAMEKRLGGARPALPRLPRGGRGGLPDLPGLHDEAPPGVRHLPPPARGAVAGLPVLRDADRPRSDDDGGADRSEAPAAAAALALTHDVVSLVVSAAAWPSSRH